MSSTGGIVGGVVAGIVVLIIIALLAKSIVVVHQSEGIVIESFGKFKKVLNSGLHFITPFIDSPRSFQWRVVEMNEMGRMIDKTTIHHRIDMRESVFNFLRQEVFTKDTVLLDVNALMYYRITSIYKAVYDVADLQIALSNTAQTQIKEVFGEMTFTEALISQKRINENLVREFYSLFKNWGVETLRMELLDLRPKSNIAAQMKKQMIAERERRGDFIKSEGKKMAIKLEAEGRRLESVNLGLAKQEATKKISEGQASAKIEVAHAEALALDMLSLALQPDGVLRSEYQIAQRYLTMLSAINRNSGHKTLYLPYDLNGMMSLISNLPTSFGINSKSTQLKYKASKNVQEPLIQFNDDKQNSGKQDFTELD
ncbi:hypothetical protein M0813_17640 [Anaeramoeba flamelloides]|uniref:Band 7 domain-containing protein n=1 Tax=Anaeramoeba flamelloides TaxID=1746091 RepID=A0ABQ8YV13_9EUKA|nr:hypothetical protein M0813_17640 [Anaeramoeba flamelloides]